jgi:hypothetical protein
VTPIFVHVWSDRESVYDTGGQPESAYHPDPTSAQTLSGLAQATGGKVFAEGHAGAVTRAVREALGRGPTRPQGIRFSTRALGPYFALAALLPLLLLLREGGTFRTVGRRALRAGSAGDAGMDATSGLPSEPDRVAV